MERPKSLLTFRVQGRETSGLYDVYEILRQLEAARRSGVVFDFTITEAKI